MTPRSGTFLALDRAIRIALCQPRSVPVSSCQRKCQGRGYTDSNRGFNRISANSMRLPMGEWLFVPEGQCDPSLARSAWESPPQKSRPVGYGLILTGNAHFDSVIAVLECRSLGCENRRNLCVWERVHHIEHQYGTRFRRGRPPGLTAPDHSVPYGTVLSGDASQALRAWLRSDCPSGTKYILRPDALIKLARPNSTLSDILSALASLPILLRLLPSTLGSYWHWH
jgi:hypothetical protein